MAENSYSLDKQTFSKLRRLYIIALSAIALIIITSQILIHSYLVDQESDSRIVNVAGRQRMLSQKLAKEAVLLTGNEFLFNKDSLRMEFGKTLALWKTSHEGLKERNDSMGLEGANSKNVKLLFNQLEPYYDTIESASHGILQDFAIADDSLIQYLGNDLTRLLRNEPMFLTGMDAIVNQYEIDALEKVNRVERLELILMAIALALLLLELLFIFWPAAKSVKNTMAELIVAQEKAKQMALDADTLSEAKEKSVQELKALYQSMDKSILFARLDLNGEILYAGEKFSRLFGSVSPNMKFSELISSKTSEQMQVEALVNQNKNIGWKGEIKGTNSDDVDVWLDATMLPFHPSKDRSEILIICVDITDRKNHQYEIEKLTRSKFEERFQRQKDVARQIIENQENEQNRIAKDIHDGIGQMLTGLKLNLESIDLEKPDKAEAKIEKLKDLAGQILKGVRTATFNLTPPELSDYGVGSALAKLVQELSKLTNKSIHFINKTDFDQRLDGLKEINIYRITQEAINNAIKYANSNNIVVSISHSSDLLSVVVEDDGKGFNPKTIKKRKQGEGGMGLTFMEERVNFINGRLFVNSEVGKGTKVTLNIPI